MSDFFREVDEELRNERMKNLWKRYGIVFIAIAVLIVAGTGAYRGYIAWNDSQAAASGDRYLDAMELFEDGEADAANAILKELSKDGHGAYPVLAKFRIAASTAAGGDSAGAIALFDALTKDGAATSDLQDYAALQAAMLAVDAEPYEAVKSRVAGLVTEGNVWRDLAHEALALSAWKAGEYNEAARWVGEVTRSPTTSEGLRQRINTLRALLVGKGIEIPGAQSAG